MTLRRPFAFATFAAALFLSQGCATALPGTAVAGGKQKVVIQVSDSEPAKWNLALNNAQNIQKDLGAQNVEIEIVAYGPGIGMVKAGSTVGSRVAEATMRGMHVVACENTMGHMKLARSDMLSEIEYTPAGVVEIMRRQREGWAYLRP